MALWFEDPDDSKIVDFCHCSAVWIILENSFPHMTGLYTAVRLL